MSRSRKFGLAAGAVLLLAGGVGIGLYLGRTDRGGATPTARSPISDPTEVVRIKKPVAPPSAGEAVAEERDALAGLNDPKGSIETDLRILEHLFSEVRTLFPGVPTGTHEEIVAFLQGANRRGIRYFPTDSPNLDGRGRIVDRWGAPYVLHPISRNQMEIRSAGPDGLPWSEDDIVSGEASRELAGKL